MNNTITIISGPIGAGKTTVTKQLVEVSTGPVVYIEGDKFWPFMAKGYEQFDRVKNFTTTMAAMVAAAIPYARTGYQVIVDFSIPPWFLPTVLKMLKPRDVSLQYVVIRPSEAVCINRAATRAEGKIHDYEPFRNLYASYIEAPQHIINNDITEVADIAAYIRQALDDGKFQVEDWSANK